MSGFQTYEIPLRLSLTHDGVWPIFWLRRPSLRVGRRAEFLMLRQILQALRFAIADFCAVPWPAAVAMSVAVAFLGASAYVRIIYGDSHQTLQWALIIAALMALMLAGRTLKKR